ncbi:nuclear transport factor 2 family protein [Haliea sp.]|uniref:nuclear transport factor 2 family protein n=1 Tax=Haliea sp. TaxID=1932666 RepID=UPI002579A0D8|nr:nuclear transport factor 2 family protein [Haliea sp.]
MAGQEGGTLNTQSDARKVSPPDIHPLAALLRGFAVDFITGHDIAVAERIMAPEYCLSIGGHLLNGRDAEYLPPTAAQIHQFPGLCVTVHDVIYGENALAMKFTEHGASSRDGGRAATWRGVTLFRTDGRKLSRGWAEEDYFARKRQLTTGICDAVDPPHPMPWDVQPAAPDLEVESVARRWLCSGEGRAGFPGANWLSKVDDSDPQPDALVDIQATTIDELFSAGNRVAFHLQHEARYRGGFAGLDSALVGSAVTVRAAGMLTVCGGEVVEASITTDRLGLYRSLRFG